MPRHSSALGQADPGQSPAPRLGALPWPPKACSCRVSPFFSFPHPEASCGASQTLTNSRDTPRAEAGTTPRYNQAKGAPCLKSPSALPRLPPPTRGLHEGKAPPPFVPPQQRPGPGGLCPAPTRPLGTTSGACSPPRARRREPRGAVPAPRFPPPRAARSRGPAPPFSTPPRLRRRRAGPGRLPAG